MDTIEKERKENRRKINMFSVRGKCLEFNVGQTGTFEMLDIQTINRTRMSLNRLRKDLGMRYETEIEGNTLIVTRIS
ncbi:MAG: hypothetical protein FWF53_09205 [Candidatus Azobacteroides sp.]|nr:hypothetical protein [Candidatus Azobacteroides sp.]